MWAGDLANPPPARAARFVIEDDQSAVVGFVTVGPADWDARSELGEVHALYVDPESWDRGFGRALLEAGVTTLASAGFSEAVLWVHPGNRRAREFYQRYSWRADGTERRVDVLGIASPQIRYRLALTP